MQENQKEKTFGSTNKKNRQRICAKVDTFAIGKKLCLNLNQSKQKYRERTSDSPTQCDREREGEEKRNGKRVQKQKQKDLKRDKATSIKTY